MALTTMLAASWLAISPLATLSLNESKMYSISLAHVVVFSKELSFSDVSFSFEAAGAGVGGATCCIITGCGVEGCGEG